MNITFLIGNGFDLKVGMKTRYSDFLEYYLNIKNDEDAIINFKGEIEKWSDFEKMMGEISIEFEENMIESYTKCFRDVKEKLANYLKNEEAKTKYENEEKIIIEKMIDALINFSDNFKPVHKDKITKIFNFHNSRKKDCYFINFNYTKVFDKCLKIFTDAFSSDSFSFKDVVHIHGTCDRGMILGVNDETQFTNKDFANNKRIKRTWIKPNVNNKSGYSKDKDCVIKIENSNIICIFGMSLGSTDKFWWETLIKWLENSISNYLIIFAFAPNINNLHLEDTFDNEDEIIDNFFSHYILSEEDKEKLMEKIIVVLNSDLFNFNLVPSEIARNAKKILDSYLDITKN